jgi:hypothetical protein
MPSPEEYRQRAKKARNQAKACRHDWERQGLLIIADQCERLAAYKDLMDRVTTPTQAELQGADDPLGWPMQKISPPAH